MKQNVGWAIIISVFLVVFAIDFAVADVTGAGATTNTQSTTGSSATNTAITGGYHSEATTNYQSGSSSSTTTNNSTTNNNNSYTGDTRTVPSASAPGISAMSQDLCTVGVGLGIQKPLIGGSIGITKRDMNCERMKLSKLLFDFNMKVAAVSILCQDSRVFSAMAHAGTPCPFNGKIGDEALDEWNKYDQQRPDYEEYTKTLRYMEKVDAQILEGLDEKEAYIVDGSGNPVNLGSE
tara:strand:+ start:196 stop:903 length:708 start_codon:yes stop_codon:yes gene_type:complete